MDDGSPDSTKDSVSEMYPSDFDEDAETSELDEEECERLKNEHLNEMMDLERQFLALKEQLYLERLNQLDKKLEEVRAGVAQEYLAPLDDLVTNREIRTHVSKVLRDFKLKNIKCLYEAEEYASRQNLESEKDLLRDQIRQDVEEKIRRLEEDRNLVDSDVWGDVSYASKKKRRFNNNANSCNEVGPSRDQLQLLDRRRKPIHVAGPYIVYMLKDSDILEDWTLIKKASRSNISYYH